MSDETGLVRMLHPRLGERHVRVKAVGKMRQNGWTVADEVEDEAFFFRAGMEDPDPVRMVNPRSGAVRHVDAKTVNKMTENGWRVVELDTAETPPDEPPKPKRRRRTPPTSEAPETDSGAFSGPETEQEGSS